MVADQRKRVLSHAATSSSCGSQEQYRAKKRDFRLAQYDFNVKFHVSLKWDDNGKRVVAKEEQVGLSWRHLRLFVPATSCSNTKLAGVLTVPREVFKLDDLTGVLSNEAWESLLSENERSYLSQFLPQGLDPDEVVQALLGGDSFHFGNPCSKWTSKLCSGGLHPDAIVLHERSFKTNKKEYYSELQQYHDNMIRNLLKVKERCARSKDPEAEFLQFTSRSLKPEDGVAAMSESLPSMPGEKLYCCDNQKLSVIRDSEIQKRILNDQVMMHKHERLAVATSSLRVSPKLKKSEKLQKTNTISNDGAKYMSYVKISKKQHELVKSLKQSGSSIQSRSLNRVLGNLNSFNVKPYEMFVEEEQNRIHEHWSNLANNDLSAALQSWGHKQSERKHIMSSLLHELEEKLSFKTTHENSDNYDSHSETQDEQLDHHGFHVQSQDETLVNPEDTDADSSKGPSVHQQNHDSAGTQGSISSDEKDTDPSSTQHDSPMCNPPFKVDQDFNSSTIQNQCSAENASLSVEEDAHLSPAENRSSVQNPTTLNVDDEFLPMNLNTENNVTVELDTRERRSRTMPPDLQVAPQSSQSHSSGITEEIPCSSGNNVWSSIGLPETFHLTPPTIQYASYSQPSFRHTQFATSEPASLISMDSDLRLEDTTKDLLNRHSTDHIPFFNPYPNGERSELLHSLIKHDTYHLEQKKMGLEFHPTSSILLEPTQFHNHFRNQMTPSFTLDNRPKAQDGLFMNPNIQENIYSDTSYPLQGQEQVQSLNVRDWANTRLPAPPIQAPQLSSADPSSHSWFAADNRVHNGRWSASESPSLGCGSSGDLYSVLTQCNTLRAQAPSFIPMGPAEQIISPMNYRQDMAREIRMSSNNAALPETVSPFEYLNGNEINVASSLRNTNMEWMSLRHQNPGLQDPSARPYFNKSWNQ